MVSKIKFKTRCRTCGKFEAMKSGWNYCAKCAKEMMANKKKK